MRQLSQSEMNLKAATARSIHAAGGIEAAAMFVRVGKTRLATYYNPRETECFVPVDVAIKLDELAGYPNIAEAVTVGRGKPTQRRMNRRVIHLAIFEIGPANIRDVSFIAGNLRDNDKTEVLCQLPEGITAQQIGYICTRPGTSFIAYLDSKPVMVFGFDPVTLAGNVLNAWAFGTKDSHKVIHQLTLWLKDNLLRDWINQGVTRIEARSFVEHVDAHKWLKSTGAVEEGTLIDFGRNGEQFIQFAWHRSRLKEILRRLADGISVLDDQNAQALTRDIYQRTGIVPKSALNQIRRGLGSTDPQQAAAAGALVASLQSDRPNEPGLLGARDGGSELEKAAITYRDLTDNLGYSPEAAGQYLADMNDPQKRREREALLQTETAKEAIKDINADTVAAALDPEMFGFDPEFRDPNIEAFAVSEYRQLFKENIINSDGNMEVAESLTNAQIARRYGVSDYTVAGDEKIVRYPVEKVFGSVGGNHDWIGQQALAALQEKGIAGISPDPKGPAGYLGGAKVYLEPSIETELDIKAGRPPRYRLRYEVNGKVEEYPGHYVPNHFIAWYLDRNEDLETAHVNHAENRARKIESNDTLGSIMGGIEDQMRQRDARARERQ